MPFPCGLRRDSPSERPTHPVRLSLRRALCGALSGAYRAHNPSASRVGFHFPQLLSPRCSRLRLIQGGRDDGCGRTLRRRVTLIFAGCPNGAGPSRMTVIRREATPSRSASPGGARPCRIARPRVLWIVPAHIRRLHLPARSVIMASLTAVGFPCPTHAVLRRPERASRADAAPGESLALRSSGRPTPACVSARSRRRRTMRTLRRHVCETSGLRFHEHPLPSFVVPACRVPTPSTAARLD
jgi:hypothetical protein